MSIVRVSTHETSFLDLRGGGCDRLFDADHLAFLEDAFPSLREAGSGPLLLTEAPYLRSVRVAGSRQARQFPIRHRGPKQVRKTRSEAVFVQ